MREDNQLRQAVKIIEGYTFAQPLSRFLADYFRANKQMGSRDRKIASQLVYSFFRLGKSFENLSIEERIIIGTYLCTDEPTPLTGLVSGKLELPDNNDSNFDLRLGNVKMKFKDFNPSLTFPFSNHLSSEINKEAFGLSHLRQPRLFIRLRKKHEHQVKEEFAKNTIEYKEESNLTLSFTNGTALQNLESFNKGYFEIQDLSSQMTSSLFRPQTKESWWDCCAASGGKSLCLIDEAPDVKLLVTDLRDSVLSNLKERFSKIRFQNYVSQKLDLTSDFKLSAKSFDGIILDAPCTGSGTWGRTPEMISSFEEASIHKFQEIQRTIAASVLPYLKPGKPLIYITCSVFKEENEDVIEYLLKTYPLILESSQVIHGYESGADSMFVARLIKN